MGYDYDERVKLPIPTRWCWGFVDVAVETVRRSEDGRLVVVLDVSCDGVAFDEWAQQRFDRRFGRSVLSLVWEACLEDYDRFAPLPCTVPQVRVVSNEHLLFSAEEVIAHYEHVWGVRASDDALSEFIEFGSRSYEGRALAARIGTDVRTLLRMLASCYDELAGRLERPYSWEWLEALIALKEDGDGEDCLACWNA